MPPDINRSRFVQAVGAISIGVGILDATKPRKLARSIGISSPVAFQLAAARELICGVGAIASPSSRWPIALRLAGDVADSIGIAAATWSRPGHRDYAVRMGGAVALLTVLDLIALMHWASEKDTVEVPRRRRRCAALSGAQAIADGDKHPWKLARAVLVTFA